MSDGTATAAAPAKSSWWVGLVLGIVTIVFGVLFLTNPAATSVTFALVVGMYWFARGIVDICLIFADRTMWGLKLAFGALGIIAGWLVMSLVINKPLLGTLGLATAYVWVLGIMGIAMGIVDIVQMFQGAGWGRGLLGVLMILLGGWLMLNPTSGALALPWVIGVLMIAFGAMAAIASFAFRE